jgi:hypothetical protein
VPWACATGTDCSVDDVAHASYDFSIVAADDESVKAPVRAARGEHGRQKPQILCYLGGVFGPLGFGAKSMSVKITRPLTRMPLATA